MRGRNAFYSMIPQGEVVCNRKKCQDTGISFNL